MSKLTLNAEDLRVVSFETDRTTEAAAPAAGITGTICYSLTLLVCCA